MRKILFFDDERTILRRLKNIFKGDDFHCIYENQWSCALDLIEKHEVDLVVIDIHRFENEGTILLETIGKSYPHILRVGMINFDNQFLLRRLLEENLVQHIIFKPWHDDEVHEEINKIMKTRSSIYQKPLIDFISKVEALPTLPQIYYTLTDMIKAHASMSQVGSLIEEDLALTAFVLKVANSAYYGRKTGNVVQAIMKIGLSNLKDIVLSYSISDFMTSDVKELNRIREKAMITNRMMTEIYEKCLHQSVPIHFASAGLLHDIGQLLLLSYEQKNPELLKNISACSHQSIGAYLLHLWGLPYAYVEAAMFHHKPFDMRVINKTLIEVLAIVHYHLKDIEDTRIIEDLYEKLNLDPEEVQACVSEILKI